MPSIDLRKYRRSTKAMLVLVVAVYAVGLSGYYETYISKIFGSRCDGTHYSEDLYLAYCGLSTVSNYEHGAFYYSHEPEILRNLKAADVLFLGNSRLQEAFSTSVTEDFFRSTGKHSYYLMGFGYNETVAFSRKLMTRHNLRPKIVVVNSDGGFFKNTISQSWVIDERWWASLIIASKKHGQKLHAYICDQQVLLLRQICSPAPTRYRSRKNGHWVMKNISSSGTRVAPAYAVTSQRQIYLRKRNAREFQAFLRSRGICLVITQIPSPVNQTFSGQIIGDFLGARSVIPEAGNYETHDGSHLAPESAKRWSGAFFKLFGDLLEQYDRSTDKASFCSNF